MNLDGLHGIATITGDPARNFDFYAGVLGLRLDEKAVSFDAPEAYHRYFGDEHGSPGSVLTWFGFAGAGLASRARG
jgi:glyoxalase family protein